MGATQQARADGKEPLVQRTFSLAHLTLLQVAPAQLVTIAAQTGYQNVGLRLRPSSPGSIAYPLMQDAQGLQETLSRIRDTGVGVFDLEIIRIDADFQLRAYLPFFEVGARLGAKAMLVAGDDPNESRLTHSFAALCEASAPFGLSAALEFMPWTKVPDARTALRVVAAAGRPNGGVLVDALHFGRSATTLADVAAIPRARLHYAQICDAPSTIPTTADGLIHTARCERLPPGEGGIDIAGLFSTLPGDLPVSVEIPNEERALALGPEEWARQALVASKAILARAAN
jgi:sugar phosphate isomerase/epimerase